MDDLLYDGWMILAALIPSIGLLFLFYVILKHFVEGDRRERAAIRKWEAEQGAERTQGPSGSAPRDPSEKKQRGGAGIPDDPA